METKLRIHRHLWVKAASYLFAASILTACGGSGGSGGNGNIGSEDNTGPGNTGSAGWQIAELIATDGASPQIAAAKDQAVAVWAGLDERRALTNIYASHYSIESGWSQANGVAADNQNGVRAPQVAMNAKGDTVVIWQQSGANGWTVHANRYDSVNGWDSATEIGTEGASILSDPQVAISSDGSAMAIWEQYGGGVYVNRYEPETGWSDTAIRIQDAWNTRNPQIAMGNDGSAVAVWQQREVISNAAIWNIYAKFYDPVTGWGESVLIETDNTGDAENPQLALNSNGSAVVVWKQHDGSVWNIWSSRFDRIDGWSTAERIDDSVGRQAAAPQVALADDGRAVAVWSESVDTTPRILAARYEPVSGWGNTEILDKDGSVQSFLPQVVFVAEGSALVVWHQLDAVAYGIYASRYDPADSSWGMAQPIESNDGSALFPRMASDSTGTAWVVWQQDDGIWANLWHSPSS